MSTWLCQGADQSEARYRIRVVGQIRQDVLFMVALHLAVKVDAQVSQPAQTGIT